MEAEDIRWLGMAAQHIAHEAKQKSLFLVRQGLKPIKVDNAFKKTVESVVPTRAKAKEIKQTGEPQDVETTRKIRDIPRNAVLVDLHLDRLVEVATGPERETIVRILDTELHKGQRKSAEKLLSLIDKSAARAAELGLKDLDQIKKEWILNVTGRVY